MKTAILAAAAALVPAPAPAAETVPLPSFRSVQLRGGGEVLVRHGAAQRVVLVEGSSAVTRFRLKPDGQLEIDACNERCPHRYRLRVLIESPGLPGLAIDGGGRILAEGGFPAQDDVAAAVRGGGEIDARAIPARNAHAAVKGGGAILVRAAAQLNAAVMGGGSIRYWGDPHVTSAVMGGGSVDRAR